MTMRYRDAQGDIYKQEKAMGPWISLRRRAMRARLSRRLTALFLTYLMLHGQGVGLVQSLRAETAGATAPEVTKFEPVDTTDLVNLASGDFTYNIPIINVPGPEGGYPLALNYHSGIRHGEEASWVGLGWNLQPGSIARGVRGYPDDFKGERISKNFRSNDYETYGASISIPVHGLMISVGINYTTYRGFGGSIGVGFSLGSSGSGSVTMSVSPGGDVGVSAGIGYTFANGASLGISMSDTGHVTGSAGVSKKVSETTRTVDSVNNIKETKIDKVGISLNTDGHSIGVGSNYSSQTSLSMDGKTIAGAGASASAGVSFSGYSGGGQHSESWDIPFFIGSVSYSRTWIDKDEDEVAYGYFYHHLQDGSSDRVNEWNMESDPNLDDSGDQQHVLTAGLHYAPSYDGYSVMGQGTGGNIRPTRLADRVYHPRRVSDKWYEGMEWPWAANDKNAEARFVFDGDNSEQILASDFLGDAATYRATNGTLSGGTLGTQINGLLSVNRPVSQSDLPDSVGLNALFVGKQFRPGGGARVVRPAIRPIDGKFMAFDVWEVDGKHYTFGEPVYNWWSENFSANVPEVKGEYFRSKVKMNAPYAYAWYLSELRYPDYLDADGDGVLSAADHGGWVHFEYAVGVSDYRWHTSVDGQLNDGPLNREDRVGKEKAGMRYSMEYGAKELKYLSTIETATHRAIFVTSSRSDAAEVHTGWRSPETGDVKFVKNLQDPTSYLVQASAIKPLGINLENPPDVSRKINGKSWELLSHEDYRIEGVGDVTDTFKVQLDGVFAFAANGLPFVAPKNTVISCQKIQRYILKENGIPKLEKVEYLYEFKINTKDQFWQKMVPGVDNPFPELKQKWDTFQGDVKRPLERGGMRKLDEIYLIEKSSNSLVKQVHFSYSYDLASSPSTATCTPNSRPDPTNPDPNLRNPNRGKLTLLSVQVFGRGGKSPGVDNSLPPYRFYYDVNPSYGDKYKYDRWGFHKSNGGRWNHRDPVPEDQAAWNLTRLKLPTGGMVYVQYEPKDYARVQDRFPLNPRANAGMVANYQVDLNGWLGRLGLSRWPATPAEWTQFHAKLADPASQPWMELFAPAGDAAAGVPAVTTSLNLAENPSIPIKSAPNPSDLKYWLSQNSPAYQQKRQVAQTMIAGPAPAGAVVAPVTDGAKALHPKVAAGPVQGETAVERMVNFNFEFWTMGTRPNRRLQRPYKDLQNADIGTLNESDTGDNQSQSAVVMMRNAEGTRRSQLFVTDPDFEWPRTAPKAIYVTWTQPVPKVGGGARVKRVVSSDGRRSYTTTYSYVDYVNGEWTSSGVAANEPPPFGYAADDDRVIQTEKGGWANEVGGGIYHSRVTVRHGWSEEPLPAGVLRANQNTVTSPMGESVFRFISPADLPHRQKDVERIVTYTDPGSGQTKTNSARLTEVFNMGGWWGKPLWKEERDRNGVPLNRVEQTYTQLDGYLRYHQATGSGRVGKEKDWEVASNTRRADMSYDWVTGRSGVAEGTGLYLPDLVEPKSDPAHPEAGARPNSAALGSIGYSFAGATEKGYLNSSVALTLLNSNNGTQSSLNIVRELNIYPLVGETRTYGERLFAGATRPLPSKIERSTVWDARTGLALESRASGRGSDWVITRNWPAYWIYPGMDRLQNAAGAAVVDAAGQPILVNMLSQMAQTTTSRLTGGQEVYLNSKASTWFRPEAGTKPARWIMGGDFVWNGRGSASEMSSLLRFPGYPTTPSGAAWAPNATSLAQNNQPFKAQSWLFAGAVTSYDAYGHALEAVDGDGVFGCSRYGYPYDADGQTTTAAGILPVAKFANAKFAETLYFNFEGRNGAPAGATLGVANGSDDPMLRLDAAYTGERACVGGLSFTLPAAAMGGDGTHELRYFVRAANEADARATYSGTGSIVSAVQAERSKGGFTWWLVRVRVNSGSQVQIAASPDRPVDDVAAFPWRRAGAPAAVSHFAYDRVLGLVTSITGSNGRTTRYRYDLQGRLKTVYDVYGKQTSATRYLHAN